MRPRHQVQVEYNQQ